MTHRFNRKAAFLAAAVSALLPAACATGGEAPPDTGAMLTVPMKLGQMADYGATPWYTDAITLGSSPMHLAIDSGANFFWATSDKCQTTACNAHLKVNTTQPGFTWIDTSSTKRSFGPWGDMYTWTGSVPVGINGVSYQASNFFASVQYEGPKFEYLAWGGGIGMPSTSTWVEQGSGFLMGELFKSGVLAQPEFAMVTEPSTGMGYTYLGGPGDPSQYVQQTEARLAPKKGAIGYLWGTELENVFLGGTPLPALQGQTFFLDSGSSRFKGDAQYLYPIMTPLSQMTGPDGQPIFTRTYDENGNWTGLYYTKGGPSDYQLPDVTLNMGETCYGYSAYQLQITLSPEQYSYYVQEGDQAGKWALAFHRLDGVGGLLVGSTFMDLVYSRFTYGLAPEGQLIQSDMYLYRKSGGAQPKTYTCIYTDTGEAVPAEELARRGSDS